MARVTQIQNAGVYIDPEAPLTRPVRATLHCFYA